MQYVNDIFIATSTAKAVLKKQQLLIGITEFEKGSLPEVTYLGQQDSR